MNPTDLKERIEAVRPKRTTYIVRNLRTRAITGSITTGNAAGRAVEVKYIIDNEPYIRATDVSSKFDIPYHEVLRRVRSRKWSGWIRIYGVEPGPEPVIQPGVVIVPPMVYADRHKRIRKRRSCIIDGYRFESLTDAADFLEINTWNVFDRIHNKNFPEWQYE